MRQFDVVIADDSEPARRAIRMILDSDPQFRISAEAMDGEEAVRIAKERMPDLVLMDINMPKLNGIEATRQIKQELPYVTVVILSVSDDVVDLFEANRSGAQGYLVKSLQPSDWVDYLHGVLNGDTPVTRGMAERLLTEFIRSGQLKNTTSQEMQRLTTREREILERVATGATNREIALQLCIAENTVKNHLKNILAKLHIQNRVQLAIFVRDAQSRRSDI